MACKRTKILLPAAHTITIHKAQGMTLDRLVIELGEREIVTGITYMALSRTKPLYGRMLKTSPVSFPLKKIVKFLKLTVITKIED